MDLKGFTNSGRLRRAAIALASSAACAVALSPIAAAGQPAPPASSPTNEVPIPPAPPKTPGEKASHTPIMPIGESGEPAAAPAPKSELLREGAFLSRMRGEMRRLSSGRWAFVFNPDTSGKAMAPMVMLPCTNLAAMEQIVESRQQPVAFAVSGQVFVFQGANYLLPMSHATVSAEAAEPVAPGDADKRHPADAKGGAAKAPGELAGAARADPSVDALIKALDEATPARRETQAPQRVEAGGKGLWREGTFVVQRRGRISRGAGGDVEFVMDNDADSPATGDPAMTLLPCQSLGAIEQLVRERDERLSFIISGRVFVYNARNYLLPTLHQVAIDQGGNMTSAQ